MSNSVYKLLVDNNKDIHWFCKTCNGNTITTINMIQEYASGLDQISTNILKMLGNKVGEVLCILFKKTMNESEIPSDWKSTNVVPLS